MSNSSNDPKKIIEIVLEAKIKNTIFRLYETNMQKWLLLLSLGSFLLGILVAIGMRWPCIGENNYVVMLAYFLIAIIPSVFIIAYQITVIIPDLMKLMKIRCAEREISQSFMEHFNHDINLINSLSKTYEIHHLKFAKEHFLLMAKQLRERIGILVGALDKVGLIPIAITAFLGFRRIQKEELIQIDNATWAFVCIIIALIFLYSLAVRMTLASQWMEEVAEIYDQAIAVKLKRECNEATSETTKN